MEPPEHKYSLPLESPLSIKSNMASLPTLLNVTPVWAIYPSPSSLSC